MKKEVLKIFFSFVIILSLASCEAIAGAITGGLVIREPDDNDLILNSSVEVEVKCYEGDIARVECGSLPPVYVDCSEGSDYAYFNVTLSEGSNTITVYGYDVYGSYEDSDSVTVRCDTQAPNLNISTINGATFNSLPITITGTASDTNGIKSLVYRGDYGLFGSIALAGTSWSVTINSLKDKTSYYFEVVAEDIAGRTNTRSIIFTYDTGA